MHIIFTFSYTTLQIIKLEINMNLLVIYHYTTHRQNIKLIMKVTYFFILYMNIVYSLLSTKATRTGKEKKKKKT